MNALTALGASAAPVALPVAGRLGVEATTGGDVWHAARTTTAMISFFTRSSGSSQLATYSVEFYRGSGDEVRPT
jgi:hypothetical protein